MEVTQQDMKEVKDKVLKMEEMLSVVYYAVVGNTVSGGGFADMIKRNEKRTADLEDRMDELEQKTYKREVWMNIAWCCAGAVGMAVFSLIVAKWK